jgi:UDP-N-acetylmuramyl pentapeptide phosphotransferase/UDP-N-acetylglucosamine-1-phosphate transferase
VLNLLDIPGNRSSHVQPTPRGAGIAIVACVVLGLTTAAIYAPAEFHRPWLFYLFGALLVANVSWLDDIRGEPVWLRFLIHFLAALMFIVGTGYLRFVLAPLLGRLPLAWLGLPLTLLWLVGMTNAYNFMDGIDGLAGNQALIAGVAWFGVGIFTSQTALAVVGLLLVTSTLGFLAHNWPPASIFMGDVGSAFLGFTLAAITVIAGGIDARLPVVGALFIWPFIFDPIFTILSRLRRRENVFRPHRSHLYQRLVIGGYSHRFVTLLYSYLALGGVFLAWAWFLRIPGSEAAIVVVVPLMAALLWGFVVRHERRLLAQRQSAAPQPVETQPET